MRPRDTRPLRGVLPRPPVVLAENPVPQKGLEPQGSQPVRSEARGPSPGPFFGTMRSLFRTQRELALENLALRQQVGVLTRTRGGWRLHLGVLDRAFWVILSKRCQGFRRPPVLVSSEPGGKARAPGPRFARSCASSAKMAQANATWGAPRIRKRVGEARHRRGRVNGREGFRNVSCSSLHDSLRSDQSRRARFPDMTTWHAGGEPASGEAPTDGA